jgi:small-conductance mechanosensitive channel
VGIFISLGVLKLDKAVVSLLAGVGIIGLALGFAFQDMAANFMSGIAIAIKQPFKINDIIKSKDYFGTVKKINLRTTDILTPQGQIVLIPNKEVFQNALINFSETGERRVDVKVGVSYGDDLEKVKRITLEAIKDIHNQNKEKPVELFYEEFGGSSINCAVRVWISYNTNKDFKKAVSEIIEKIKAAYDKNNISIPFPTTTLDFNIKGGEKLSEML